MPDRNKYIKIAVRKFGPFESVLQKQWKAFCKETGCDLSLQAIPMELPELHQATLAHGGLKQGEWDIAHISSDWITEAYSSEAVEDLSPYIFKNKPENYPDDWPLSLLKMQSVDQKIFGLPFHDGPECLIYRKDLFEDPEYKKEYRQRYGKELLPPQTWKEFITIAGFFQSPGKKLYGAVFAAYPDGHNAVFDFCLQAWTRGGELINDQGNIDIHISEAAEGLEFFRKLFNEKNGIHPQSAELESVNAGAAFARGEIAMMVNWFGFASFCEFSADSLVKGKINVTTIPSGANGRPVSLNSYWMYMIGKGSLNKELAYDFIKFAINKDNDTLLTEEGGIGCRRSTWKNEEINKKVSYFNKLEELHLHAKSLPSIPCWPEVASVIDEVMQKAIHTNIAINEILEEGQEKINKLL